MRSVLPLSLLLLAACDPAKLTESEAETFYAAQNTVVGDLYRTVYDAVDGGQVPDGLSLETTANGGSVAGELDGGADWDGAISLDGSLELDNEAGVYGFVFDLTYVDVQVPSVDVTLNGTTALDMAATLDTAAYAFSYSFDTGGAMDVAGEANGHADFAYTLAVDVNASTGAFTFDSQGDVNGFDTSGMSLGNLAAWVANLYL